MSWFRRRFGISSKLFCVCAAFSLPIVVMFVLMTRAQLGKIEFAEKELIGDAVQRPLQEVLEHVSRHRRLALRRASGDHSVAGELAEASSAVSLAIARVAQAEQEHGETLQFTPDGLRKHQRHGFDADGLRRKWALLEGEARPASAEAKRRRYDDVIRHVRTMITHGGDTSNLILDPDLDSYYLMDVTLLALPQMEERVQQIVADVEAGATDNPPNAHARRRLFTYAAFLRQADWERIASSTETAITTDPAFYGVSPSLAPRLRPRVELCADATDRVVRRLEAEGPIDLVAFRKDADRLERELHAFHRIALDEEDALIEQRIHEFRAQLRTGFVLAAISLLISAMLAFGLASNVVRRVKHIARATESFAKGDLSARVGAAGGDEIGELAGSFDAMAARIGALTTNLENEVEQRTAELARRNEEFRLILDNVNQGMLTVDRHGVMLGERSAVTESWLGAPEVGSSFAGYVGALDATVGAELELGFEQVDADVLPLDLALAQLPRGLNARDRHLRLGYQPIFESGELARILVLVTDVTEELAARRSAARQEEILRIFQACQRDRSGFLDYFVDARDMVQRLCAEPQLSALELRRVLHTLKGNSALFGVLGISALCHELENRIEENGGELSAHDVAGLQAAWAELASTVTQMLGEDASGKLEVADEEYAAVVEKIARGAPRSEILDAIVRWKLEPAARRLERFAEHARSLARRLGKDVDVSVEANDVRLCPDTWAGIWNTLTHVVRNAVDHGLESRDERAILGKPMVGRLGLRAFSSGGALTIEIADDGRGIAWERLFERAKAGNLPCASRTELLEAMFVDGISTREHVTEISGRGVGMAAVRAACRELGGEIIVESEPRVGTTVRCVFPRPAMGGATVARLMRRCRASESVRSLEIRT